MRYLPLFLFYLPLILRQLLTPVLISAGAGFLLRRRFGWVKPFCIILAVLMILLTVNLLRPVLICPGEFQPYLSNELREGIYEFFPGWENLPVIPLFYRVTDGREGCLEVTEYLLYGGKMRFTVSMDAYGNVVPEMLD